LHNMLARSFQAESRRPQRRSAEKKRSLVDVCLIVRQSKSTLLPVKRFLGCDGRLSGGEGVDHATVHAARTEHRPQAPIEDLSGDFSFQSRAWLTLTYPTSSTSSVVRMIRALFRLQTAYVYFSRLRARNHTASSRNIRADQIPLSPPLAPLRLTLLFKSSRWGLWKVWSHDPSATPGEAVVYRCVGVRLLALLHLPISLVLALWRMDLYDEPIPLKSVVQPS